MPGTIGSSGLPVNIQDVIVFRGLFHRIHATTAVNLSGSTIGTAGIANDTYVTSVFLPANATAVKATLTGFAQDETGASASIVLTGSTTVDQFYQFCSLVNYQGPATITATIADLVVVSHTGAI